MSATSGGRFDCLALTPAGLEHAATALAAARAGAVGVLDFTYVAPGARSRAIENLRELVDRAPARARVGVRADAGIMRALVREHADLIGGLGWLLVVDPQTGDEPDRGGLDLPRDIRRVAAVRSAEAAARIAAGEGFDAVVVSGSEVGGRIGERSTFMTCQRLQTLGSLPWYLHGAVGAHSAAACRLAGAAGVVIDDQLLLMPESPLPPGWRRHLEHVGASDCVDLGETLGEGCRVLRRPGLRGAHRLAGREHHLDGEPRERDADSARDAWRAAVADVLHWGPPGDFAWPVGQAVCMAAGLRDRYGTVGRFVQALLANSGDHLAAARDGGVLAGGGPLAAAHGTEFPVVQGPMTRVSDVPEFAGAVADAGGLPMTALALLRRDAVRDLLTDTARLLGERPWGVGILGFVPPELRAEQVEVIREVSPPFALIAGGRPDQVLKLQRDGIDTYVHVPVPSLLSMFLDQGIHRFVFEGRECGGHVGPLCSLQLWDTMVDELLQADAEACARLHLLFAGGIHDQPSAAMVAAVAAPLAARGARIGVLMGTAYLFTHEALSSGAIVADYQEVAVACDRTVSLGSAPGHANRCADTPFAREFVRERRRMRREGLGADQVRDRLEDLQLGRLRLATKGIRRDPDGELQAVDAEERGRQGMYMLGEVAAQRSERISARELHRSVSDGAQRLIGERAPRSVPAEPVVSEPADVAVVGMAAMFPGAGDATRFWRNLLAQRSAIEEIPAGRWDWRLYAKEGEKDGDWSISRWGGFIEDFAFEPLDFGIPPNSMANISPAQLIALQLTREAFADAGWDEASFDGENAAVVMATSDAGSMLQHLLLTRSTLRLVAPEVAGEILERLPEWAQESFTGTLCNIVAGRVANRFDCGGPNVAIDSACAASLSAIDLAVHELTAGRSNVAIVGGVDVTQTPLGFLAFSNTQALSPTGSVRTFDKKADGIVTSDGGAVLLLKRLADAERDGDRIYAVIKAIGASSDGRALGMTAPRPRGQRRALERAYQRAGFPASAIGLYEAHGTGTKVGDEAELETIGRVLRSAGADPASCAVGSAKTLIGHAKTAAGMAGLIKCIMALHDGVLPPHAGVDDPLDPLTRDDSPAYLLDRPVPWLTGRDPRRASVSAFGFGGTNAHCVVEEYRGALPARRPGGAEWPCELLTIWARDAKGLEGRLTALREALDQGAEPPLSELAAALAERRPGEEERGALVTLVVDSNDGLRAAVQAALSGLAEGDMTPAPGVRVAARWRPARGELAFLFPGQGSQRLDMAREATLYLPEMRSAFERSDELLAGSFDERLSRSVYPPASFTEQQRRAAEERLTDTRVAQPALGTVSLGLLDLCSELGLEAGMVGGHSYGELTALAAAGAMARDAFIRLSERRGAAMGAVDEPGTMAAVHAGVERVQALLPDGVVVANENSPGQTVISGTVAGVERAIEALTAAGVIATRLPVAAAFHSPLMEAAARDFCSAAEEAITRAPSTPVYSNFDGEPYSTESGTIAERLVANLTSRVRFVSQVRAMHRDGARVFIEVGAGNVLTGLVGRILEGERHVAVALDGGRGMRDLLEGLARLFEAGVAVDLAPLFQGRIDGASDVEQLLQRHLPSSPGPTTWLVNSMHARPASEPARRYGPRPLLDAESAASARRAGERLDPAPVDPAATPDATVTADPAAPDATVSADSTATDPTGAAARGAGRSQPSSERLRAWEAYQKTMRQFLRTQEHIVSSLLGAGDDSIAGASAADAAALADRLDELSRQTRSAEAGAAPPQPPTVAAGPPAPGPDVSSPAGSGSRTAPPGGSAEAGEPTAESPVAAQANGPGVASEPAQAGGGETDDARAGLASAGSGAGEARVDRGTGATGTDDARAGAGAVIEGVDAEGLLGLLVELVAERTGYPPEMLGADLDVEAELGVDSIKRLEVLDQLLQRLPAELAGELSNDMDRIGRAKTLNAVVEAVLAAAATIADAIEGIPEEARRDTSEPTTRPDDVPTAVPADDECPRFVVQMKEEPLAGIEFGGLSGVFLISEDDEGVATALEQELEERGVVTVRIPAALCEDDEALHRYIDEQIGTAGTVRGIVHLASMVRGGVPGDAEATSRAAQRDAKSLFEMMRAALHDLRRDDHPSPPRVIVATRLDGMHGRSGDALAGSPTAGAGVGMLNTLALELPGVLCKAVDFDDALGSAEIARHVADELRFAGGAVEIGYRAGVRHAARVSREPLSPTVSQPTSLRPGEVALVTGGASGITAATLETMVDEGVKVVVVGRTELADEPEELARQQGAAAVRAWLLACHRERGESPTPAEVEARVRTILHRRIIHTNLARLEQAGARVEYHALDVADSGAFATLIESVYQRHGRLDAVIHGAGVIEDKLVGDKTRASFDRVFDTKVDAAFTLLRTLRAEGLRFVALFASTAGRFGNRGQIDYAAANEVLNRIAWTMHHAWPATRVVSINWGPWAEVGMASEAINERFAAQGILPIPVRAGSTFAGAEMAADRAEVEIVAGHGPWEEGGTLLRDARRLGALFDLGGLLLHDRPGEGDEVH